MKITYDNSLQHIYCVQKKKHQLSFVLSSMVKPMIYKHGKI